MLFRSLRKRRAGFYLSSNPSWLAMVVSGPRHYHVDAYFSFLGLRMKTKSLLCPQLGLGRWFDSYKQQKEY